MAIEKGPGVHTFTKRQPATMPVVFRLCVPAGGGFVCVGRQVGVVGSGVCFDVLRCSGILDSC